MILLWPITESSQLLRSSLPQNQRLIDLLWWFKWDFCRFSLGRADWSSHLRTYFLSVKLISKSICWFFADLHRLLDDNANFFGADYEFSGWYFSIFSVILGLIFKTFRRIPTSHYLSPILIRKFEGHCDFHWLRNQWRCLEFHLKNIS